MHSVTVVASRLPHTLPNGESIVDGHLFTLLPTPRSRWKSFATGWGVQALSLISLLFVGVRVHQNLVPPDEYRMTNLVSYEPPVVHQQPVAPVAARPNPPRDSEPVPESKPLIETKPTVETLVVTPQRRAIHDYKQPEPDHPAPELKLESKMPVIPTAPVSKIVAVGTFSVSNAATAAPSKPSSTVQTGGFGDPNGVPSSEHHGVANIREGGSFDLPSGSGRGNGSGSGGRNQGVVASSGFGTGAIDALNGSGSQAKTASPKPTTGATAPVEITFKPKPDYTDEGRKQKINGEVRLEVLFKSDGQVHVIRVLQGLGYGLDEQAVKAAEQIKFKPALHEGQPIDSMAQVHIIFELIS
jgi:TonB family protein